IQLAGDAAPALAAEIADGPQAADAHRLDLTAQARQLAPSHLRPLPGDIAADEIHLFGHALLEGFVLALQALPAVLALRDVGAVITAIALDAGDAHLPDGVGHAVEEVAVMAD